jgi:hypothetical protein
MRFRIQLAVLSLVVASCRSMRREPSRAIAPATWPQLTDSMLGQLSYPNDIVAEGRVQLHDGDWQSDSTSLGDRVVPESLWVAGGRVHLRIVTHDSTDGLCCPTRRELQVYRLLGDSLMLERAEFVGRVPPEPLGE